MQSLLITGGNLPNRELKARELAAENSSQFDIHVFDTAENHGIDLTRDIIVATKHKPFESKLSNIIILEAGRLTSEAQNALLKLLEEPNETLQLILTATSRDALLPTVASRLSEINLAAKPNLAAKIPDLVVFKNKSLSEKLTEIERLKREDYISLWHNFLQKEIRANGNNLKSLHRYNKLVLKMQKAEKVNVNKKLIELILALEAP